MRSLNYYLIILSVFVSGLTVAQNMMPLPPHSSLYSGSARGFWFVAPQTFVITGLRVPSQAGSGNQAIQVVKINDPMPIAFGAQSSNFNTLFYTNTGPNGQIIPVNILINVGDTIGILGTAGTGNSYGNGSFNSSIFGQTVPIQRFGYQGNINTGQTNLIWGVGYQAAGSISRVEVYYEEAIINSFPYCQSFESNDGSWTPGGIQSSWEWGQPSNTGISSAAEGLNAWVTDLDGDHNNDEFSHVQSPEFDFSSLVDPAIRVMVARELQNNQDGVQLQAAIDGGSVYSALGTSSSPAPWYNSGNVSSLNFYGSQHGWTGNTLAWTEMIHSLSQYANDTSVFLRFALATNGSVANEGFGFDDIVIAESDDINYVALLAPDSSCGSSATSVEAVLCNNSVIPQTGFNIVLDTNGTTLTVNYNDTIPVCGCDTVTLFTTNTANGANWTMSSYLTGNSGDVRADNDSAASDAVIFPIPTGDVTGGGSYCQGDVAQLTFTFNGTQPFDLSFTDGSNGTFIPGIDSNAFVYTTFTGGNFEIIALADASGCPGDTGAFGGVANVVFNPAPPVDLGPDSTICSGYSLDAGSGMASYAWNTGATTQTITPMQSGTFTVTVTDNNGCDNTDEIELEVNPSPVVNLQDTVLCEGSTFTFNAGGGYQSYLWDDGSTGQVRIVNSLTTVFVTVTDFQGCEGTATASITSVVTNPSPNVQTQSGLAPLTLDAGAGYASYQWITGATTQTIQVFTPGTYTVTVTDDSGCEGEGSGKANIWPNGIVDVDFDETGIAVYPNPAKEFVKIAIATEHAESNVQMQVLDINGRMIGNYQLSETDNSIYRWQIPSELSSGQYLIRLSDLNGKLLGEKQLMLN